MPELPAPVFARSPFLVCYWQGGQMVLHNYATGARIGADPGLCAVIDRLNHPRTLPELCGELPQYEPSSVRATVLELARRSFLDRSDRGRSSAQVAMSQWTEWSPAAAFYHFSTKDLSYVSALGGDALPPSAQSEGKRMPAATKSYPQARHFVLPTPKKTGELPQALLARRTWRQFSSRPLSLSDLSTLLWLTWGVQRWVAVPGVGRLPLKTSPSGGARHPLEVYVAARRVTGLPPGVYHYASATHRLELLRAGVTRTQISQYLPAQPWFATAAAVFLMTAVFPRVQWRYPNSRAYRAVLIEAGHACQTFCLVSTWLRLAPFCTMALADSRIERDLGLNGVSESVLYAAGIGARPAGVDWAPWPRRRRAS